MDTQDAQPLENKPRKKSLFVRVLVYTLGIVFFILIGFMAGRVSTGECGKVVLGAHTPSDSLLSSLAMLLKVNPEIPTQQTVTVQSIPTPTTQPNQWPTFPSPTPTPQPNNWPTFTSPTPTPTLQPSQSPTPSPTSAPIAQDKIKNIVSNAGITLVNPKITTDTNSKNVIVNGDVQDKLFGIIPVSFQTSIKVNQVTGVVTSVAKPWWQNLIPNPFAPKVACSSLLGESSCLSNGCEYWSDCNKCESFTTPYDPTCTCDSIKDKNTCSQGGCEWHSDKSICTIPCSGITDKNYCDNYPGCRYYDTCGKCGDANSPPSTSCKCTSNKNSTTCGAATDCEWHPECISGGGACADKGLDSIMACGKSCDNIAGQEACTKTGCTFYPRCGLCHDYPPPDSCLCHVIKNQTTCDSATGCEWHPECAGGLNCVSKGASSLDACGDCININSKDACSNTAACHYYDTCGKCGFLDAPPDPSCSCAALKSSDECAAGWNCKWYSECGAGGSCANTGLNSVKACGSCKNITDQQACTNAGCAYSNYSCK